MATYENDCTKAINLAETLIQNGWVKNFEEEEETVTLIVRILCAVDVPPKDIAAALEVNGYEGLTAADVIDLM